MFDSSLWLLPTVLGPVVIAAVVAYALLRRRRLTPAEKQKQHEAVDHLYKRDEDDGSRDRAA